MIGCTVALCGIGSTFMGTSLSVAKAYEQQCAKKRGLRLLVADRGAARMDGSYCRIGAWQGFKWR